MIPPAQPTPLLAALEQLGPREHLCSICENQQEHFAVAIPFIRIGLDRGEKCIYIADNGRLGDVREALQAEGIDVDCATESKALTLTTNEHSYLKRGSFDLEWTFTFWKEATELAMSEGFTALRATGETEWVLRGDPGLEHWIEYECRLTHALSETNCLSLCQYNRRLFPPDVILEVLRTHPIVVYGATTCRNFYHVPQDEFLRSDQTARKVDRLLNSIREHERVESALREKQNELRRTQEILVDDISQRNRAEEELRRCETHLAEGQRLSHTGSWTWNVSSGEVFWSREALRILAFDSEKTNPNYSTFLQTVHPDDRLLVEQTVATAIHHRRDWELDYRIVLPDLSIKYVHAVGHPMVNEDADLLECIGTVMDVTVQHQGRAALEKALEEIKKLKDQLNRENLARREEIDQLSMFEEIVGSSPALQAVLSRVARVAPADSTVLIVGEDGHWKRTRRPCHP